MSINLQKGQKIDLTKGGSGLKHIMVGLGWDEAQESNSGGFFGKIFSSKPQAIDCDASAILCNSNGKYMDLVYYRNLNLKDGSIVHQGDNLTGEGEGDDEVIFVDLDKVPADIEKIDFTITIYDAKARKQNFGMIQNAYVRVLDDDTKTELVQYDLDEDYSVETAMVMGELYRNNGEWKFAAVGQGFKDGLEGLVKKYGLNV